VELALVVAVVVVVVDDVVAVEVDVVVGVVVVEVVLKLFVDKAAAITGVGLEVATDEPFLFVATTTTRNVDPTSAAVTRSFC
jgi:hypothetical protein